MSLVVPSGVGSSSMLQSCGRSTRPPRAVVVARVGGVGVGAGGVGDVGAVDERELPAAVEVAAALRGAVMARSAAGRERPDQRAREDERQHRPAATPHDPLLPQNESLRKQTTETEGCVPAARGLETRRGRYRRRPGAIADAERQHRARALAAERRREDPGEPRRALRGEELRDPLRAPARRCRRCRCRPAAPRTSSRSSPSLLALQLIAGREHDLAARALVQARAGRPAPAALHRGPDEADPPARALLAPAPDASCSITG